MYLVRKLWSDDAGFIVSAELVLVATVVVIGLLVGLASLRNQVVQELVDVGQAIGSMSQSYALAGTKKGGVAWTDASSYGDKIDFCQDPWQQPYQAPGGISVSMWPENAPHAPPGGERAW